MSIKSAKASHCQTTQFWEIVKLFKDLDEGLEYPNCEGFSDEKRLMQYYEKKFFELIKQ